MAQTKTLMMLGAHHDDNELSSGGTLAKYRAAGWRIVYATLIDATTFAEDCPYYCSHPGVRLSFRETLAMREDAARHGAAVLGAEVVKFFHFKPMYFYPEFYQGMKFDCSLDLNAGDDAVIEGMKQYQGKYLCSSSTEDGPVSEVLEFIVENRPDVIITHCPSDLHCEHYFTAACAHAAAGRAVREYGMKDLRLFGIAPASSGTCMYFRPDTIIDITDTIDIKRKAVDFFIPTQQEAFSPGGFPLKLEKAGRYWGKYIGVEYAEAFAELPLQRIRKRRGSVLHEDEMAEYVRVPDALRKCFLDEVK